MVLTVYSCICDLKFLLIATKKQRGVKSCEIYLEMFITSRAGLDKNDSEPPTRI